MGGYIVIYKRLNHCKFVFIIFIISPFLVSPSDCFALYLIVLQKSNTSTEDPLPNSLVGINYYCTVATPILLLLDVNMHLKYLFHLIILVCLFLMDGNPPHRSRTTHSCRWARTSSNPRACPSAAVEGYIKEQPLANCTQVLYSGFYAGDRLLLKWIHWQSFLQQTAFWNINICILDGSTALTRIGKVSTAVEWTAPAQT